MKNFKTRFNSTRKMIIVFFILSFIIFIAIAFGVCYLGVNLFHNPESIGEFFGTIANGYKNAN